jgi:glutathione S-transferase
VTAQEKSPLSAQSKVARIVFIDQEKACECTMNKIQASWTALQAALGPNSSLDVERIHRDTQEEQAEEYRLLRPMVTVPGIYLLDDSGAIVELLQGEVTQEQVRNALAP